MKHKNSILITGGSGMIGSQADFGIKPNHQELDILDPKSIANALDKYKPSTVLHLAAMINMAECEKYPERAHETNVTGTYNITSACKERNIKLIYISTCAVFDGTKKEPYSETDMPNPLNVYGKTKWLGEKISQELIPNTLIVRTGWLFGGRNADTRFIKRFFEQCQRGEEIKATVNRSGSPTYVPDLLNMIEKLLQNDHSGIVHVANNGAASYFEVGQFIKKITLIITI